MLLNFSETIGLYDRHMTERGLYSLVLNSATNSELCHTLAVRHNSLFVTVFKTRE